MYVTTIWYRTARSSTSHSSQHIGSRYSDVMNGVHPPLQVAVTLLQVAFERAVFHVLRYNINTAQEVIIKTPAVIIAQFAAPGTVSNRIDTVTDGFIFFSCVGEPFVPYNVVRKTLYAGWGLSVYPVEVILKGFFRKLWQLGGPESGEWSKRIAEKLKKIQPSPSKKCKETLTQRFRRATFFYVSP